MEPLKRPKKAIGEGVASAAGEAPACQTPESRDDHPAQEQVQSGGGLSLQDKLCAEHGGGGDRGGEVELSKPFGAGRS